MSRSQHSTSVPLSPEQFGRRLGVTAGTVRAMIKRGQVRAYRVGGYFKIDPSELDRIKRPWTAAADDSAAS